MNLFFKYVLLFAMINVNIVLSEEMCHGQCKTYYCGPGCKSSKNVRNCGRFGAPDGMEAAKRLCSGCSEDNNCSPPYSFEDNSSMDDSSMDDSSMGGMGGGTSNNNSPSTSKDCKDWCNTFECGPHCKSDGSTSKCGPFQAENGMKLAKEQCGGCDNSFKCSADKLSGGTSNRNSPSSSKKCNGMCKSFYCGPGCAVEKNWSKCGPFGGRTASEAMERPKKECAGCSNDYNCSPPYSFNGSGDNSNRNSSSSSKVCKDWCNHFKCGPDCKEGAFQCGPFQGKSGMKKAKNECGGCDNNFKCSADKLSGGTSNRNSSSSSKDDEDNDDGDEDENKQFNVRQTGNCPSGQKIGNTENCKMAADQLGLTYRFSMDRGDRPSGCYTKSKRVYYNSNSNGSLGKGRKPICVDDESIEDDESITIEDNASSFLI